MDLTQALNGGIVIAPVMNLIVKVGHTEVASALDLATEGIQIPASNPDSRCQFWLCECLETIRGSVTWVVFDRRLTLDRPPVKVPCARQKRELSHLVWVAEDD